MCVCAGWLARGGHCFVWEVSFIQCNINNNGEEGGAGQAIARSRRKCGSRSMAPAVDAERLYKVVAALARITELIYTSEDIKRMNV